MQATQLYPEELESETAPESHIGLVSPGGAFTTGGNGTTTGGGVVLESCGGCGARLTSTIASGQQRVSSSSSASGGLTMIGVGGCFNSVRAEDFPATQCYAGGLDGCFPSEVSPQVMLPPPS